MPNKSNQFSDELIWIPINRTNYNLPTFNNLRLVAIFGSSKSMYEVVIFYHTSERRFYKAIKKVDQSLIESNKLNWEWYYAD